MASIHTKTITFSKKLNLNEKGKVISKVTVFYRIVLF